MGIVPVSIIVNTLVSLLGPEIGKLLAEFLPVAEKAVAIGGGLLLDAAKVAVEAEAAALHKSGADKLASALDAVKQTIEDAKLEWDENAARAVIEALVAKL